MREELTSEFKAEAAKDQCRPIEFYDLYLGSQDTCDSLTLYFTSANSPVTFYNLDGDSKTYIPLRLKRGNVVVSGQLEIEALQVDFDNAEGAWNTILATKDIKGKRIVIRKAFLDLLNDPSHVKVLFSGILNCFREITETSAKIELKPKIRTLNFETGNLQQLYCEYIFGDEFCGFDPSSTKIIDQTIDAGSTTTEIFDNDRTETEDYFTSGVIWFTSGANIGEVRGVAKYDAATRKIYPDYALPHTPEAGDTYDIAQGCDKSYTVCKNRFANQANFGGHKDIPPLINPKF